MIEQAGKTQEVDCAFRAILEEHRARYPRMEPQDYGKLIFQSEYGPEHMLTDKQGVLTYLREELSMMSGETSPQCPEEIGGGLCRFPLSACPADDGTELLAELFILTGESRHKHGIPHQESISMEADRNRDQSRRILIDNSSAMQDAAENAFGLQSKLDQVLRLGIPGMKEWAESWKAKGCPAVHHSKTYNETYHPHYRLLRRDYAGFFPVLLEVYRSLRRQYGDAAYVRNGEAQEARPLIIGIDGRCGSGKTSLAGLIARLFPCNVIHMDDFYLPLAGRGENWTEVPGGNMDFQRLCSEVLRPIRQGKPVYYRAYNCRENRQEEAVLMPSCSLEVVEGSYSHYPLLAEHYDLKIFLTCSDRVRRSRLQKREGGYYPMFEERWIPLEENYFRHYAVEAGSDCVVDTEDFW